jgi:hypothetical protein
VQQNGHEAHAAISARLDGIGDRARDGSMSIQAWAEGSPMVAGALVHPSGSPPAKAS